MRLGVFTILTIVAGSAALLLPGRSAEAGSASADGGVGGGGTAPLSVSGPSAAVSPTAAQSPSAASPSQSADGQSLPSGSAPSHPSGGVASGLLECRGAFATGYGFGSRRDVKCEYRAVAGPNHYYTGTLERVGLDLGISDQGSMLWAVVASTPDLAPGALAGKYVGMSSGVSLGPGFSANILMSQDASRQITLQPLSISSDSGISVSLAGATLTLEPSSAPLPQ